MAAELEPDEELVLRQYKVLKEQRHGDLEISVKDGRISKLWMVEKVDLLPVRGKQESAKMREIQCS